MISAIMKRVESRLAPHTRLIAIVGAIWFWLGVAIQARFVRLPDWPWIPPDWLILWSGIAANALWWAFLRPALSRHREARLAAEAERAD